MHFTRSRETIELRNLAYQFPILKRYTRFIVIHVVNSSFMLHTLHTEKQFNWGSLKFVYLFTFQENAINYKIQESNDKTLSIKIHVYHIQFQYEFSYNYSREERDPLTKKKKEISYLIKFWFQSKIFIIFCICFYLLLHTDMHTLSRSKP